ncbi:MAG: hypothetical protein ACRDYV_11880 [Acidimicrobiia bacterium]
MDLSKLKTSDWVIGASGLVLLIASFLDWFTVSIDDDSGLGLGGEVGAGNGWDVGFFWAGIPVLIGLAMIAIVAIRAFSPETNLPDLPIGWGQVLFIAGVVAAVIVLLKLLIGEDGAPEFGIEVSRAFGLFLASLAAIGLAVGGFLKWQEERSGAGLASGTFPQGGEGAPPPPPPGGSTF